MTRQQENPWRELELLVRSHFPIVVVESVEEQRAERLLVDVAAACGSQAYLWSVTTGLHRADERERHEETRDLHAALAMIERIGSNGALYVLRDLAGHLADPVTYRHLLDIARLGGATIATVAPEVDLPEQLRPHAALYALPKPDVALLDSRARTLLRQLAGRGRLVNELTDAEFHQLVHSLRGLTLDEVDRVLTRLVEEDGKLTSDDVRRAIQEKGTMISRGGIVELVSCDLGMEWVAGFPELKRWLRMRARAFEAPARSFGLEPPKGVLLTGVPGCGKSFVVKALAHDWNMPLLRLDAGALYDRFIGASERNLRDALQTAEALAPCVLWIDEIEKGFAVRGPSESDGGLGYRMVGALATWMQERTAPVFIAATSNDITLLPPELTRQGRFDDIFFVDLPDVAERQHLFAIQLARRNRDHARFDCATMAEAASGFSGSEIEQSVVNALYAAYHEQRDVETRDVLEEIDQTRPLSAVSPQKVAAIRQWGAAHARPA